MMNQKIRLILLAIAIAGMLLAMAFIIAGCSAKDPLSSPAPSGPIMPLAVGNGWLYGMYWYLPGNAIPTDTAVDIVQVIDSISIENEIWYYTRHVFLNLPANPDTNFVYYANRQDGLWLRYSISDPPRLKVRYPAAVGLQFEGWYDWVGLSGGPMQKLVTSINANIIVPIDTIGAVSCYEYKLDPNNIDYDYKNYYNPLYGYVSTIFKAKDLSEQWYVAYTADLYTVVLGGGAPAPRFPENLEQILSKLR